MIFYNLLLLFLLITCLLKLIKSSCDNACSGHGICLDNGVCECFQGWGVGLSYDSGDCSQRICPYEFAWVDSPDRIGDHHKYVECSAKGICNRDTGECECFPGYEGKACSRTTCPNKCSGHGQCIYLAEQPFKSVIGDYYNYNYGVRYAIAFGKISSKTTIATITATTSFVSRLAINNKIAIGNDIYFIRDVNTVSFTVSYNIGGDKMSSNTTASFRVSFKESVSYSLLSLPPTNLKIVRVTVLNGLFKSDILHGLSVGDIVYITGISTEADVIGFNNYLYTVTTVPSPNTFQLSQTKTFGTTTLANAGSPIALSQPITQSASGTIDVNLVFRASSIIATGVFDVIDSSIDAQKTYIDRKYWDSRKTRGCLCDPTYGEIDCSLRMCGYGTDIMDNRRNKGSKVMNHIQIITMKGVNKWNDFLISDGSKGETIALTFKSKLNETFTTQPIILPTFRCSATTVGDACIPASTSSISSATTALNKGIRDFELDVEWALKKLPNKVVDDVKVKLLQPVDTTNILPTNGIYSSLKLSSDGVTLFNDTINIDNPILQFSVEFTGNNVQGTQRYLIVEAARCASGCTPQISGVTLSSDQSALTVVTKPTMSAGIDNDMEADLNSYECGRRGKCDYRTGTCSCFSGYSGPTCNIITALV